MQKRKGFDPDLEHSSTFAEALAKIDVPGPSFVSESFEASTEVTRRTPKSPTTSSIVHGKWLKA